MAEEKELFHILDDGSGDGIAPDVVTDGGASHSTKNMVPTMVAGNALDQSSFLQVRAEGEDTAAALVGMIAKDNSNDLIFLRTDASGALIITDEGTKTPYSQEGQITVSSTGSDEDVLAMSIGAVGTTYDDMEFVVSSFKDCTWKIYHVDDLGGTETETLLMRARTGAGAYTKEVKVSCLNLDTTGGSNVQAIRVKVNQRSGTGSDASCFICVKSNE